MQKFAIIDNCKKEKKLCIYFLIFLIIIFVAACLLGYFYKDNENIYSYLIVSIFFVLLFFLWIDRFLFCCFYKLEVTDEIIRIKTLLKVNSIQLTDNYKYEYKIFNSITQLYVFKFFICNKKIKVYTHYYEEFENILKNQVKK